MIGILGYGEIGKAIHHFYPEALIKDLEIDEFNDLEKMDVLHVCIPFNERFEPTVNEVRDKYRPSCVIIHSTVGVGTTKKLNKSWNNCVHSFVRGTHPDLTSGLRNFTKIIAADTIDMARKARYSLEGVGIKCEIWNGSRNSELAKILSTTAYGMNIAFQKEAYELCEKYGADPSLVYERATVTYNEGWDRLGKPRFKRPIIANMPGKSGGHCIIPNLEFVQGTDTAKFVTTVNNRQKDIDNA